MRVLGLRVRWARSIGSVPPPRYRARMPTTDHARRRRDWAERLQAVRAPASVWRPYVDLPDEEESTGVEARPAKGEPRLCLALPPTSASVPPWSPLVSGP